MSTRSCYDKVGHRGTEMETGLVLYERVMQTRPRVVQAWDSRGADPWPLMARRAEMISYMVDRSTRIHCPRVSNKAQLWVEGDLYGRSRNRPPSVGWTLR
jgi:hypothetical protein